MSRVGYIYNTPSIDTDKYREIMSNKGCENIYEDSNTALKQRQNWKEMLKGLGNGSTLYIISLSNALSTTSGLVKLLTYFKKRDIRLVSLADGWDTDFILFSDGTGFNVRNILDTLTNLDEDIRRQKSGKRLISRVTYIKNNTKREPGRSSSTEVPEKIINLYLNGYTIEEIGEIVCRKRTQIYAILKKYKIKTSRNVRYAK